MLRESASALPAFRSPATIPRPTGDVGRGIRSGNRGVAWYREKPVSF
jgi:hypothetical protein